MIPMLALIAQQSTFNPPPGVYSTAWLGNSFRGEGNFDGQGQWVQNAADEIEVSPDGTVIAACGWDEAGRCLGLYKNGRAGSSVPSQGTQWALTLPAALPPLPDL